MTTVSPPTGSLLYSSLTLLSDIYTTPSSGATTGVPVPQPQSSPLCPNIPNCAYTSGASPNLRVDCQASTGKIIFPSLICILYHTQNILRNGRHHYKEIISAILLL